jgi:uncharacterized protein YdeI (YjbR/CyaY-like superfamily)
MARWLAKHHKNAPEIWLIYYKKDSGKQRIPYNDAVEEALCYGWIDSLLKPIDATKYAHHPRRLDRRRPAPARGLRAAVALFPQDDEAE